MNEPAVRDTGWSVRIATVLGIPIRVHVTFVLILVWVGYYAARNGVNIFRSIVFVLLVFACVALHELGHAAMARRFGVTTREIVLYPIGGIARLESMPGGKAELLIALAGPAVNVVLAVALLVLGRLIGTAPVTPLLTMPADVLGGLIAANILLFLFNLVPAFPMDGGRILRAALSLRMREDHATNIAASIGQGMAFLFGAVGLLSGNYLWLFIALFVFLGAGQEAAFIRRRVVVRGHTTREAMITRFEVLAPQDSLARASGLLLDTHQQDFPVVDAWGRVAGVLSRAALLQGLAQHGSAAPVLEAMDRSVPTVRPDTRLEEVLRLLQQSPDKPVLVLDDNGLVGMVTLENLAEFIEVATRSPARESAP